MSYIDGFVIAVPTANKQKFIDHAKQFDALFIEMGATPIHRTLAIIRDALVLIGQVSQRFAPGRSRPRPRHHVKPHPSQAYKG